MMGRLYRIFLAALALTVVTLPVRAWDEVTHATISHRAIEQVKTPALKAFLEAHYDAMESGVWFPDWGHALKPHGDHLHAEYLDAAWAYLQRPDVKAQKNYPLLLAHYMGVYGHVVEDRILDATMKAYAGEVGDGGRDDMENGMMAIAGFHHLYRDFDIYVPKQDLARIYASADYFGEHRLNQDNLAERMARGMAHGEIMNRRLTELSFLTAAWTRQKFPFAAANMETAPGGFNDQARAVAAVWEAIWMRAQGRPAPFFVYAVPGQHGQLRNQDPASALGRILVITSERFDIRDLAKTAVHLSNGSGEVAARILPYIPEPGHEHDLAFVVQAERPWILGGQYTLDIRHRDSVGVPQSLHLAFTMPRNPPPFAKAKPEARPMAFGLWLAAALLGVAALLYGLADMGKLTWAAIRRRAPATGGGFYHSVNAICKAAAVGLTVAGFWVVATDGEWLIAFLRHHH